MGGRLPLPVGSKHSSDAAFPALVGWVITGGYYSTDHAKDTRNRKLMAVTMGLELARQLDEQGYVLLENAMGDQLLADLRSRIHEILDEEGEHGGHEFKTEEHAHRLANLVDKGEVFRRAILLPDMLAYVRQ